MSWIVRSLLCLLVLLATTQAWAKKKKVDPDIPTPASLDAESEAIEGPEAEPVEEPNEADSTTSAGIECSPAISEVETNRPIPVSCAATNKKIERVEIRFKPPSRKKWSKIKLKKVGDDFQAQIPCTALAKTGPFKLSIVGFDRKEKPVARIANIVIKVVKASNEAPPAYPGQEPPQRCYSPKDCPAELKGSAACPGTKAVVGKASWGAACKAVDDCQAGLACVAGSCERPTRCDINAECGKGGECVEGFCKSSEGGDTSASGQVPSDWIGISGAFELAYGSGTAACASPSDDDGFHCYQGDTRYTGTATRVKGYGGDLPAGFRAATARVLLSYEHWFSHFALGARFGYAFLGSPRGFSPLHAEARALLSLRGNVKGKRFRPYVGVGAGFGQVDYKVSNVPVLACKPGATAACQTAPTEANADAVSMNIHHNGARFFVAPTLGFLFVVTGRSALTLNASFMLPVSAIQVSAGYAFGL